ncbi:50S ribosomal protein L10 [Candidatus Roizmanbacteria bacterium]|nr:MAG: 50S ribosomal protein L10 [Candidatus Roizmanbacteria bacterium]
MANQAKKTQVVSLVELLNSTPNFALVKYEKTKHKSLEELRKGLKEHQAQIRVVKNTLLQKALQTKAASMKEVNELVQKSFH